MPEGVCRRGMSPQRGSRPLQVVLLCCVSFAMGFSFAMANVPLDLTTFGSSLDQPSTCTSALHTTPGASAQVNDDMGPLDKCFSEFVNATLESENIHNTSLSGEELTQLFRGALIQALRPKAITNATVPKTSSAESFLDRATRIPQSTELEHFSGIARVDRKEFTEIIDTGHPIHLTKNPNPEVMILYGSEHSLPSRSNYSESAIYADISTILPANDAVENCGQVAVVHVKDSKEPICWAFVPGQESFQIQKWLRVAKEDGAKLNPQVPLRLVSRNYDPRRGIEYPRLPDSNVARRHWDWLGDYFSNVEKLASELRPLADRVAVNNQVIVTVVNAGQAELLLNFACAAESRGLNYSNILAFVLDEESKELVEALGMTAYYHEHFLGKLPSRDPRGFGDKIFTEVVIAKFMCTHLFSVLGYDFLFQDVDVVWYKEPLSFFNDPDLADPSFDMFFQDDFSPAVRFRPLRGNSGFYYVRNNERTRSAMKDAILKTDQLEATNSHQQTLLELLSDHISYHGLRIKVYDGEDTNYFPTGGQFHHRKRFMLSLIRGQLKDVYLFHMNWTKDKAEKLSFMKQLGMWFVRDSCHAKPLKEVLESSKHKGLQNDTADSRGANAHSMITSCCSREYLFSCHYRDKPSAKPCKDSPPYVAEANSFW